MSLREIRSECTDVASLLQPHVDGELSDEERKHVAEHLDECGPCMAAVSEQLWIRSTLRALEPEAAPQSLRASILLGLDGVDQEQRIAEQQAEPSTWERIGTRARALLRGGMIMIPAGAVAGVMFVAARGNFEDTAHLPEAGLASALTRSELGEAKTPVPQARRDVAQRLSDIRPKVGFPVQVVDGARTPQIELVGARIDDHADGASAAARLRYKVLREGRETGRHVIDRQRPVEGRGPAGTPVTFRGRRYFLGTGVGGEPVVHFQRGGVAHMVMLEGVSLVPAPREQHADPSNPDFSHLLDLADQLAEGSQ